MNTLSNKSTIVIYASFLVLIAVIYGQTIHFNYALDDQLINEYIPGRTDGLKGLFQIFQQRYSEVDYRPMVILSFAAEKWMTGELNPQLSHFINLILFCLTIVAAYRTISLFSKNEEYQQIILLGLLLFIAHPVHVEVISSLKCRDNLLSCLITILSLNFFLRYFFYQKHAGYLCIGILLFIIAVFSKIDAAGLIFLLPVVLFVTKKIKFKSTFLLVISLYLFFNLIRFSLIDTLVPVEIDNTKNAVTYTENTLVADYTLPNRIAAAGITFWYYIKMLVFPFGYRYYYGFDAIKLYSFYTWQSLIALLALIASILLILKYLIKDKILMILSFGFISFILYALNFIVPAAGIIADRYIFISSLFFCGITSYVLSIIITNKKTYYIVSGILIITLSCISYIRTTAWKDKLTLIETDAPYLLNSYEGMRIAAATYIEFADKEITKENKATLLNKAIHCAESGNALYPQNLLLHKLMATAYFKLNNYREAKRIFKIAIKNAPDDYESYNFLGDIFYLEKELDSTCYYYQKAFSYNKNDETLISNISSVLYEKGDKNGCIDFNEKLITKNDSLYAAWENLGYFYLLEKDTAKAVNYFENGFKHGLQNPEMAGTMVHYLLRTKQPEKAKLFKNYIE